MTLVDSLTRGNCIEREAINPARAKAIKEYKKRRLLYTRPYHKTLGALSHYVL